MAWNSKIKELVAVGASITANCHSCLQFHTGKALEFGASEGEIAAAVATGRQVRQGAHEEMEAFVSDLNAGMRASRTNPSACCS